MILDGDPDVGQWLAFAFGLGDGDLRVAAAVQAGVVDQVGHDAGQSAPVTVHDQAFGTVADGHASSRHAADSDRLAHELGDEQVFEVQADRAGVEPGDLQQVLDESLEPGDIGDQQVERRLGALGHVVAASLHHLDAGGECHQRRAQLVADIAGESGVAFDAVLQRLGHVVERGRQQLQVVVVGVFESGVEATAGDGLGGLGSVAEWTDRPFGSDQARAARRPGW